MIYVESINNWNFYGGLAGLLLLPVTVLMIILLNLLSLTTVQFDITYDAFFYFGVAVVVFGLSGLFMGGIFGFIYAYSLIRLKNILDSSYLQICKVLNRIALALFGISVICAFAMLISSVQNADTIMLFFFIVWFCWTPLTAFILVNLQLIHSDRLHL